VNRRGGGAGTGTSDIAIGGVKRLVRLDSSSTVVDDFFFEELSELFGTFLAATVDRMARS